MNLTKEEVIKYFGSVAATARAISRDQKQVRMWKDGELTEVMHLLCEKAIKKEEARRKRNKEGKYAQVVD